MGERSGRFDAVVGILALASVGGCNCSHGSSLVTSDGIPVITSRLDFGNVQVGQTFNLGLPLLNGGSGPLDVNAQAVSGPPFAETTPFASAVAPGGRTTALLSFSPTASGPAMGTLIVSTDGTPSAVAIVLTGNGVDLALTTSPGTLSFGQVPVGLTIDQTVTFQNDNDGPVYVSLDTATTAAEYVVERDGGAVTNAPVQIPAGGSYPVTVAFTPDMVSIFNSSFTYTACADAAGSICLSAQPFSLSGQGVTGNIALNPDPIVFSGVPANSTVSQTVTVTNQGTAQATVSCLYLQSRGAAACSTASGPLSIGTPSSPLPVTLDAGASFTVPLAYTATTAVTDTLAATYTAQGLSVSATASAPVEAMQAPLPCQVVVSPVTLTFTSVLPGTPITQAITLSNAGGTACEISGVAVDPTSDPSYALAASQQTSFTVGPDAGAPIAVTFDLDNAGSPPSRTGKLDFQSNDPLHATVQVPMIATLESPYAGGGAWPRWHHDNLQSGVSPVDTTDLSGTIGWTASLGAPSTSYGQADYMNSPVVGSDGTIYQLTWGGELVAFYPDGGTRWETMLEGPLDDPHPSTPIIAKDGTLFVAFGESGVLKGANGTYTDVGFYQIAPDGGVLTSIPPAALPGQGAGDGFDLPPILTNGGLLLGADDYTGVFAYSIAAGSVFNLASANAAGFTTSGDSISAVVGPDDTSYVCQGGFYCMAFTPPPAFAPVAGWPTGGAVTVGTASKSYLADFAFDVSFTGNLMAVYGGWGLTTKGAQTLASINPSTGVPVWSVTLPAPTAAQLGADPAYTIAGDATTGNSCPAIGLDGTVYVGNFDGLHAFTFTGTGAGAVGAEKSGFPFLTTDDDVLTAPAIGADGTIFFGTAGGVFYAITPTGTLRFKLSAGGRIAGSPAIGPSGAVYFVADDGYLYAVN